jgi:hypothetical protein
VFLTPERVFDYAAGQAADEPGAGWSYRRAQACSASGAEGLDPPKPAPDQEASMNAVVQDSYGSADVLEVREIAKPAPTDDEVLVRVHTSASVSSTSASAWAVRQP